MALTTAIIVCIFGVVIYRKKKVFPRGNKRKEADSMISEEERAILKLARIAWIYDEIDKNEKKGRFRRKIKDIFKR